MHSPHIFCLNTHGRRIFYHRTVMVFYAKHTSFEMNAFSQVTRQGGVVVGKKNELEYVCRHILSILANALEGSATVKKNVINFSTVKEKMHKAQKQKSFLNIPPSETDK